MHDETNATLFAALDVNLSILMVLVVTAGVGIATFVAFRKSKSPEQAAAQSSISFVAMQGPNWTILSTSLEAYAMETHRALETLSFAVETLGGDSHMARRLQEKIERLARIYAKDRAILTKLLSPFPVRYLLQSSSDNETFPPNNPPPTASSNHFTFPTLQSSSSSSSYESVRQVVAHLVRDWSTLGAPIRHPLYEWCIQAVAKYTVEQKQAILIPGAGLGRLAWDMMAQGYRVEALESSTTMAAAAYAMYHHQQQPYVIHPYAADPFVNEVEAKLRYTPCEVPDTKCRKRDVGTLLYSLARFDDTFVPRHQYAAVITCFFLDTATTLVDYISTIQSTLIPKGIWINVGPLQWHHNSRVPLAVDELKVLLTEDHSFQILHWSVDDTVLNYRDGRSSPVSTFSDGYRPLRFVLRKTSDGK